MGQLITYLSFNGNCREAMEFYQQCLGGELHFQELWDSPSTADLPPFMKDHIVQAFLRNDSILLMGTDLTEEKLCKGNSVSILLNCNDEIMIKAYYQNLSTGGQPTHPLQETYWGEIFGGLTDRYGTQWLFHCG